MSVMNIDVSRKRLGINTSKCSVVLYFFVHLVSNGNVWFRFISLVQSHFNEEQALVLECQTYER